MSSDIVIIDRKNACVYSLLGQDQCPEYHEFSDQAITAILERRLHLPTALNLIKECLERDRSKHCQSEFDQSLAIFYSNDIRMSLCNLINLVVIALKNILSSPIPILEKKKESTLVGNVSLGNLRV